MSGCYTGASFPSRGSSNILTWFTCPARELTFFLASGDQDERSDRCICAGLAMHSNSIWMAVAIPRAKSQELKLKGLQTTILSGLKCEFFPEYFCDRLGHVKCSQLPFLPSVETAIQSKGSLFRFDYDECSPWYVPTRNAENALSRFSPC